MKFWQELSRGIWRENAVFKLVLGMCPVLAVTSSAGDGLRITSYNVCYTKLLRTVRA